MRRHPLLRQQKSSMRAWQLRSGRHRCPHLQRRPTHRHPLSLRWWTCLKRRVPLRRHRQRQLQQYRKRHLRWPLRHLLRLGLEHWRRHPGHQLAVTRPSKSLRACGIYCAWS